MYQGLSVKMALIAFVFCSGTLPVNGQVAVKLQLHSLEGYAPHEAFARKATALMVDILNSEEFKAELLLPERRYKKNMGLTHEALYARVMEAKEVQGPLGVDGVVDMRIRTIRVDGDEGWWKKRCATLSTYGIDGVGDGVMAVCPDFLQYCVDSSDYAGLAAHYAHEYMHILGFDHSWCFPRSASFVYQVGDIVEMIAERWKQQGKLD